MDRQRFVLSLAIVVTGQLTVGAFLAAAPRATGFVGAMLAPIYIAQLAAAVGAVGFVTGLVVSPTSATLRGMGLGAVLVAARSAIGSDASMGIGVIGMIGVTALLDFGLVAAGYALGRPVRVALSAIVGEVR